MIDTIADLFMVGMDRDIIPPMPFRCGTVLNIGAGKKIINGAQILDWPEWDADKQPIPFPDRSVVGIHCYHFLEHCKEPIKILREFERVLVPGGLVNIVVPYYNSSMQAQDLDHKARFCETTWKTLFSNPYYCKYGPWKFEVITNLIIGIVERNICLMTQLRKEP